VDKLVSAELIPTTARSDRPKQKSLGEGEDDNGGGDDADGGAEAPAAKGKKVAAGKTGSPEKKATATKKAVGARKAPVKASNGMEPAKTGGKGGRKKTEPKTEEVKQEDAEASDEEKYGKSTTNHASGIEDDNNAPHWADVENAHARNMEYEEYMRATEAHGGWMTPPTPCRGNVSEEDA